MGNINWNKVFKNENEKNLHNNEIISEEAEDEEVPEEDMGDDAGMDEVPPDEGSGNVDMGEGEPPGGETGDTDPSTKKLSQLFSDGGMVLSSEFSEMDLKKSIESILSNIEMNIIKLTKYLSESNDDTANKNSILIKYILDKLLSIKETLKSLKTSTTFESSDKIIILMEFILKEYELLVDYCKTNFTVVDNKE